MKLIRVLSVFSILTVLAGVAYVGQQSDTSGVKMADAATKFLATLTPEQKTKATFDVDHKERLNWFFTPRQDANKKTTRKGLPLEEMSQDQRAAALALVRAGTSQEGYKKATTIMSLEAILRELEKGGAMVRDPNWYFFTIFGEPSKTGKWGWRVEGHHLALNFLIDGGRVVSATPAFFGANPATVKAGPRKGLRTLPEAEDIARELFKSLDEDQKKAALQSKAHPEVQENKAAPSPGDPTGLAGAKMNEMQKQLLMKLIESYAVRLPEDVATAEIEAVKKDGIDSVHFAYFGGTEPGQAYTYRIHGPGFVAEFLNVQADSAKNPANHIHSAWRHIKGDFGVGN